MAEFSVGSHKYKFRPVDALDQFELLRLALPLIPGLSTTAAMSAALKTDIFGEDGLANAADILGPVAQALKLLTRDDINRIFEICLSAVDRQDNGHWVPIWNGTPKLQFADITMPQMAQIAWEVARVGVLPFWKGTRSK